MSQLLLSAGQSFEEAIAPLYTKVVRILGRIYRDHPDADDLIQEGVICLWQHWKLNTLLFEQYPLHYLIGIAKRGAGGRYLEVWNGRTKFDGGSLDDPDNIKRPAVQRKITTGNGRAVQVADLRLDLSAAAQMIHTKYQTRRNKQFNAKKREQVAIIFRDFLDDRDPKETATELGFQVKSVRQWHNIFREDFRDLMPNYQVHGIKRPYTDQEVLQIFQMVKEGVSYREIATKLERSISSVSTKFYEIRNAQLELTLAGD